MAKMFAVVNDDEHTAVFVKHDAVGFWPCRADQQLAWAQMHHVQGQELTRAAKAGSICGWDVPEARLAVEAAGRILTPSSEKVSDEFIARLNDYQLVKVEPLPEGMEYPFADTTPLDEATDE
jgi:hypothetical protein